MSSSICLSGLRDHTFYVASSSNAMFSRPSTSLWANGSLQYGCPTSHAHDPPSRVPPGPPTSHQLACREDRPLPPPTTLATARLPYVASVDTCLAEVANGLLQGRSGHYRAGGSVAHVFRDLPSNSSAVRCASAGKQQGEAAYALFELSPQLILSLLLLQPMQKSKGQFRQPARLAIDSARLAMAQLVGQGLRSQSHYPKRYSKMPVLG